jgi:hypothetical protein
VNWHRYILRDELPSGSQYMRVDRLTMRYFGNFLLLILIVGLIAVVIAIPFAIIGAAAGAETFFAVLSVIIAIPLAGIVFMRWGVKLPAIALGRADLTFSGAWRLTDGNSGAAFIVFLLNMLVSFGALVVLGLFILLIGMISPTLALVVEFAGQLVINWLLSILGITLLTSLYGFFAENRTF